MEADLLDLPAALPEVGQAKSARATNAVLGPQREFPEQRLWVLSINQRFGHVVAAAKPCSSKHVLAYSKHLRISTVLTISRIVYISTTCFVHVHADSHIAARQS